MSTQGSLYGTASNTNFIISNASGSQGNLSVAYHGVDRRFLVVWGDGRNGNNDIYGQFVNSDGSLYENASSANFAIATDPEDQDWPAIACNEKSDNVIVAYQALTSDHGPDIITVLLGKKETVTLSSPNGGEAIPSGSLYSLTWIASPFSKKFDLFYSTDKGSTWRLIDHDVTGGTYDWQVPIPTKNKKACLVRVIGYNDLDEKVAAGVSETPFTIEVVKLQLPNEGGPLTAGNTYSVTWSTHLTKNPVGGVRLYYSITGGRTWVFARQLPLAGNPGSYDWQVPTVTKTEDRCKLKIILKDAKGRTVGSDISDGFTIQPQ